MLNLNNISTEARNINTLNIDKASTKEILVLLNNEDKTVPFAVENALEQIKQVVDVATSTIKNGGRVVYIGAGTSGRLGVLDASECPPTFGVEDNVFVGLIAGGDKALKISSEMTEDSKEAAVKDLLQFGLNSKDFLIGIAASGRTPYTIEAVKYANLINCNTACVTTSKNSELSSVSKYPIEAVTGPEPVTGSTRMKSGTAQKLVLNMISTATMIKLGKVYENLMIDVKMTNKKLLARGASIVRNITNCDEETAVKFIKKYGTVKKAIFAIISKIEDEDMIEKVLNDNENNLRITLENLKKD